ncbi:PhzF family phenazine biosynthesis protein [Flavobacterium degerlachei]|jgi:trans-2,3-dihydro-3-hydroxyanthranilate isomerase|uniref:Trans-2,3-dihydro-3-hydroxyanthranilate isomerase n=1 Tax=Flavobacterium degerlachei TaxID=229203 RepID=A0A1H2X9D0_9FLAO|nr:PhzF family phenazine biosynthesis protein [Flavobacterium degerlachei]SDW89407.1 trans-2,3-dihydro-3-hydroxyanthranilate isomerase [Flavobacterium degerlachei]
MTIPFYIIDVFTEKKYAGNQLAVFLNAADLTTDQMQQIAREINFAESTFVTDSAAEDNKATIRIFTPAHEMQFAGHPIIGTSWVLMNKVFKHQPNEIELKVPIGEIQVRQSKDLVWLKAAQPDFLDVFMKEDFASFSNLSVTDFDNRFEVQEVTTGSAFVIVPLKNRETLNAVKLDKDKTAEWLKAKCKTEHKALYFFSLENEILNTRMLCIENNQLIEDAATGSASTCLQAFLLKYHSTEIKMVNNQGEYINRKSQIFFEGKREENLFDINIGGESQFVAQGEWEVG